MSGRSALNPSPAGALSPPQKSSGRATTEDMLCLSDTKKLRDECIVQHGEAACSKWIEAHLKCLRAEGFNV